jgi:hypothetical protein
MITSAARNIVELNIQHYRTLLDKETDAQKRVSLRRLLEQEEAKVSHASDRMLDHGTTAEQK